jgi:hypothetical protein
MTFAVQELFEECLALADGYKAAAVSLTLAATLRECQPAALAAARAAAPSAVRDRSGRAFTRRPAHRVQTVPEGPTHASSHRASHPHPACEHRLLPNAGSRGREASAANGRHGKFRL